MTQVSLGLPGVHGGVAAWRHGGWAASIQKGCGAATTLTLLVEEQVRLEDLVQVGVVERRHGGVCQLLQDAGPAPSSQAMLAWVREFLHICGMRTLAVITRVAQALNRMHTAACIHKEASAHHSSGEGALRMASAHTRLATSAARKRCQCRIACSPTACTTTHMLDFNSLFPPCPSALAFVHIDPSRSGADEWPHLDGYTSSSLNPGGTPAQHRQNAARRACSSSGPG